jgi:hypothetical protein
LAAFVRGRLQKLPRTDPLHETFLYIQPWDDRAICLQVGPRWLFRWNDPGTADRQADAGITDEERWSMLTDWLKDHPPRSEDPLTHLNFTRQGVRPLTPKEPKPTQAP